MSLRTLVPGLVPADCDKIPGIQFTTKGAMCTQDQEFVLKRRGGLRAGHAPQAGLTESIPDGLPDGMYKFQRLGVGHIIQQCSGTGSALLADDMGLGKSMQALHAAQALMGETGSVCVVCPRSVVYTWVKEIERWCDGHAVHVKTGAQAAAVAGRFIVCSYDLCDKLDVMPTVLIIDEMQHVKGRNTQRAKKIRQMAALSDYRIGLTGTPIWDRPRDFWALLDILWPGVFGNQWDFDLAYCNGKLNEFGGIDNKGATLTEELKLRLESGLMLRRTREQVKLQLPSLQRQVVWVEADPKASGAMRRSLIGRGPGDMHDALEATLSGKIDAAVEEALATDKCLVFTWMRTHAAEIHRRIEASGRKCKLVHGGMTPQMRNKQIAEAQKEGASVVATIDSTGTGVDGLQHVAHIGIFHALDWRPLQLAQAEARLARIGQSSGVVWRYLCLRDSADEIVMSCIVDKLDQARSILGARSNQGLRDTLSDNGTADEATLLKELYERMAAE